MIVELYNKTVSAQVRLQARIAELDGDLYEAPFTCWLKSGKRVR